MSLGSVCTEVSEGGGLQSLSHGGACRLSARQAGRPADAQPCSAFSFPFPYLITSLGSHTCVVGKHGMLEEAFSNFESLKMT